MKDNVAAKIPFLSYDLEGQLCCYGRPIDVMIDTAALEAVCYLLLLANPPSPEEQAFFHDRARDLRSRTVQELGRKQPMYAPAMNTLQSLSACMTVYYNDWDYLNQLLVTYSAFFDEDLSFYENYGQQLWKLASRRTVLDEDFQLFQKCAIFLALSGYQTNITKVLRHSCAAQVSLPLYISLGVGYSSGLKELGQSEQFFPFFRELSLLSVESKLKKYLKNKWDIPGFDKNLEESQEFYHKKSRALLSAVLKEHQEYAAFYELVTRAETLLKKEGFQLRWDTVIAMSLNFLGVEERMLAPMMAFMQMPGWIGLAQYHSHDHL